MASANSSNSEKALVDEASKTNQPEVKYIIEEVMTPSTGGEQNSRVYTLSQTQVRQLVEAASQRYSGQQTQFACSACPNSSVSESKVSEYDRSTLVPLDQFSVVSANIDNGVLNMSVDLDTLVYIVIVLGMVVMLYMLVKMFFGGDFEPIRY